MAIRKRGAPGPGSERIGYRIFGREPPRTRLSARWRTSTTSNPMGYVQRRLASTAAKLAVSPSHVHELLSKNAVASTSSRDFFDVQTWAALQSPPKSALTAFAHRIGLADVLSSPDVVLQACTHPSFLPLHTRHHPDKPQPATNANLATLGNSLLGLFATEHVNATYPHLPTRVMKAAVSAYVGGTTCAAVAKEMGAAPLLRWQRTVRTMQDASLSCANTKLNAADLIDTISGLAS